MMNTLHTERTKSTTQPARNRTQPTKKEVVSKLLTVLDEFNENIKLFKQTREKVKEEYPKMFPNSYEHHRTRTTQ